MKTPHLINLPKILDARGNLSFVEAENHIPFEIKRTYWIFDVPGGETRGGHAFKEVLMWFYMMAKMNKNSV